MSTELALAFLQQVTHRRDEAGASQSFDTTALSHLHSVTATQGRCCAVLPVTPEVANRYGTLHGGCIATIVDTVGSAALVTVSLKGGVSLNMNVNYLSKVKLGGSVLIEAQVVKVGKTIATIDVQLKEEGTGVLVAQGTHVKFMAKQEPPMEWILKQQQGQLEQQGEWQQPAQQRQHAPGIRSKL